jgi:hypothetical protein
VKKKPAPKKRIKARATVTLRGDVPAVKFPEPVSIEPVVCSSCKLRANRGDGPCQEHAT